MYVKSIDLSKVLDKLLHTVLNKDWTVGVNENVAKAVKTMPSYANQTFAITSYL